MAPGTCFCRSSSLNPSMIPADNDSTGPLPRASTKSSGFLTPIFWPPLPISDFFAISVALSNDEELFKHFIQAYLTVQTTALIAIPAPSSIQNSGPGERLLKAYFSELYYRNFHMDFYRFCS